MEDYLERAREPGEASANSLSNSTLPPDKLMFGVHIHESFDALHQTMLPCWCRPGPLVHTSWPLCI